MPKLLRGLPSSPHPSRSEGESSADQQQGARFGNRGASATAGIAVAVVDVFVARPADGGGAVGVVVVTADRLVTSSGRIAVMLCTRSKPEEQQADWQQMMMTHGVLSARSQRHGGHVAPASEFVMNVK